MLRFVMIGLVFILLFLFFRKLLTKPNDDKKRIESDSMFECVVCGTYVSEREMITSRGRHYCSKECLDRA